MENPFGDIDHISFWKSAAEILEQNNIYGELMRSLFAVCEQL